MAIAVVHQRGAWGAMRGARISALARSHDYRGYNHSHLCEALAEEQAIVVSRRTLERILRADGMRLPRRRRPARHRVCLTEGMF